MQYKITNCLELSGVVNYLSANSAKQYLDIIDCSFNASNITSDQAGLFAISRKHNLQQFQGRIIQYGRPLVNSPLQDCTTGYPESPEIGPLADIRRSTNLSSEAFKVPSITDPLVRPKSVTFAPHTANRFSEQSAGKERG